MLRIIQKRKIWYSISAVLVGVSILMYAAWGLNLSIDFTGGSLLEARFDKTVPAVGAVQSELSKLGVKSLSVQPAGDSNLILRFQSANAATHQEIDEAQHQEILTKLRELAGPDNAMEELRFEAVGPSIGKELANNARTSIIIVILAIIAYVAWAFRHVSRPVASWKYGLAVVIALLHDVIIVVGAFAFLGRFYGIEVNSAFVAALLTVLGYSVNDTIVVFDRIRERLPKSTENFEGTINTSLNQTMVRSLTTSLTTLLALLAIIIYGGDSIRYFALALFIGIFFGTYSSIFLASPLLLWFEKLGKKA